MAMRLCGDPEAAARLHALRALYEPHAHALYPAPERTI
jgi:hypothetical protein